MHSSGILYRKEQQMKPVFLSYAGRAPEVVATRVVALYHPDTGRIHHCHTVHVHKGGRAVTEQEAIEAAHRNARHMGHDTAQLKVKVSRNAEHGHFPHTIDLASGQFVPMRSNDGRALPPGSHTNANA
jgi:hypothetical protein